MYLGYNRAVSTGPSIGFEIYVPRRQDWPSSRNPVIRSAVHLIVPRPCIDNNPKKVLDIHCQILYLISYFKIIGVFTALGQYGGNEAGVYPSHICILYEEMFDFLSTIIKHLRCFFLCESFYKYILNEDKSKSVDASFCCN